MDFIRRFGLIICAGLVIAAAAGFLINLYSGDSAFAESVFGMDFAFAADGDSSAELTWTIIAGALGAFAALALLTALIPEFGRGGTNEAEADEGTAPLDTALVERRMRETAETVAGVEHAETYAYASDGKVDSGKIDLYLDEGQDPGRISDEVADRVRSLFKNEFDSEPAEGFEVDIHQPRRFGSSDEAADASTTTKETHG